MEKSLAVFRQNETGKIIRLEGGREFNRKLRNIGIREGKLLELVTKQYFGGPFVVRVEGRNTTIGRGMARKIILEV